MQIKLDKPIVFLDFETTGVWPEKDRIIEVGMIKVFPDGSEEVYETRVDPGIKIPEASIAIHGIRDEDLVGKPKFKEIVPRILELIEGADIGGFALDRLDIHILAKELKRNGFDFDFGLVRKIDAQKIFVHKEKRNLAAASELYLKKPIENAHSALGDARTTLDVFKAQLEYYPDLPKTVEGIENLVKLDDSDFVDEARRFRWWNGEAYFNFGGEDVYGKSLKQIVKNRPGFLQWMIRQDFSKEVKRIAEEALKGKFPEQVEK